MSLLLAVLCNNDVRHNMQRFLYTEDEVRLLLTSLAIASLDLDLVFTAGPMTSHFLGWRMDRWEAEWFEEEIAALRSLDDEPYFSD
jgi:hypothetical protein